MCKNLKKEDLEASGTGRKGWKLCPELLKGGKWEKERLQWQEKTAQKTGTHGGLKRRKRHVRACPGGAKFFKIPCRFGEGPGRPKKRKLLKDSFLTWGVDDTLVRLKGGLTGGTMDKKTKETIWGKRIS